LKLFFHAQKICFIAALEAFVVSTIINDEECDENSLVSSTETNGEEVILQSKILDVLQPKVTQTTLNNHTVETVSVSQEVTKALSLSMEKEEQEEKTKANESETMVVEETKTKKRRSRGVSSSKLNESKSVEDVSNKVEEEIPSSSSRLRSGRVLITSTLPLPPPAKTTPKQRRSITLKSKEHTSDEVKFGRIAPRDDGVETKESKDIEFTSLNKERSNKTTESSSSSSTISPTISITDTVQIETVDLKENQKHQCDKCPYKGAQLKRHMKHHTFVENFFKCHYCDYYLGKRSAMNQHEVIHSNYASTQCEILAKKKKKSCSLCPYKATKSLHLKDHVSKHEFKEGYQKCRYCDYYVFKMSHLIQHEAIHPSVSFDSIFFIRKLK
jgi:hypothetical protein